MDVLVRAAAVQVWLPVVAGLGLDGGIAGGVGLVRRLRLVPVAVAALEAKTETAVAVNAAAMGTAGWDRVVERQSLRWTAVAAVAVAGLLVVGSGMV
jgi:hypothetical protein